MVRPRILFVLNYALLVVRVRNGSKSKRKLLRAADSILFQMTRRWWRVCFPSAPPADDTEPTNSCSSSWRWPRPRSLGTGSDATTGFLLRIFPLLRLPALS
jgi:hypothetical protein